MASSLGAASIASVLATAQAAREPQKCIDFVIMPGKGGGADEMARLMQVIVEKHGRSSWPLIIINKPGGSGAEALVHLEQKTDDHAIMVILNSFYTIACASRGSMSTSRPSAAWRKSASIPSGEHLCREVTDLTV